MEPIFSQLRPIEFEFLYPASINLTQQNVVQIAQNWGPTIEDFQLNPRPTDDRYREIDLYALIPFAQYCPRLRHLGILVDTSDYNTIPQDPPTFSSTLRGIDFGSSPFREAWTVIAFLDHLVHPYPTSQPFYISGGIDRDPEGEDFWTTVQYMWDILHRRGERAVNEYKRQNPSTTTREGAREATT